jgi:hypothetical protein
VRVWGFPMAEYGGLSWAARLPSRPAVAVEESQREAEHWTFRRGKAVRLDQYWGWDEVLEAVGLSE